jgi:hypothetical protein
MPFSNDQAMSFIISRGPPSQAMSCNARDCGKRRQEEESRGARTLWDSDRVTHLLFEAMARIVRQGVSQDRRATWRERIDRRGEGMSVKP